MRAPPEESARVIVPRAAGGPNRITLKISFLYLLPNLGQSMCPTRIAQ